MRISILASLIFVAAGCGSSSTNSDMGGDMQIITLVPTNFASINTDIIQPTCAKFSVCHSADGKTTANNLDLSTDPWGQLVNQPAQNNKAMAMGLLRVKPCDAANSFLAQKVAMTMDLDKMTDFGHHMPDVAGEFLTGAQIQAIKDWINRGALKDEPAGVSGSTCQLFQDMGQQD